MEEKAKNYACDLHDLRNLKYDGFSYSVHLKLVNQIAKKYIHLIDERYKVAVLCASWLHDTIEDCAITYNDIKKEFGVDTAEIVIAVTNDIRGRNRKERAESSYPIIRKNKLANFIKICDRIANLKYSKSVKSRMFDVYCKESNDFKNAIYNASFGLDEMWNELESLKNDN